MNFCKTILAASVAAAALNAAYAADPKMAEKPAVPTLGQVMEATGISVNGYIDASYTYNSGSATYRIFDTERRSFNVNALDLTLSALPPEGFGGMVNLTAGTDANVIYSAGVNNTDQFDVTQAYVHFAKGGLMVIGGKYVTLSGAEVIKSPSNTNFSRSILFGYAIPFTHTGVRAYFTPSGSAVSPDGKWTFIAGLNNGWDVQSESAQAAATDGSKGLGKTLELGANGNLTKSVSLAAVYYSGNESCGGGAAGCVPTTGERNLLDLVATFTVSDNLSFVLNYDKAEQDKALTGNAKAEWNGLAGYVNYKISDPWRVSFRTESFDDKNGFRTGTTQKLKESTLTLAHTPAKNVELRAEYRQDKSDKTVFTVNGSAKKSQDSLGLEAIYKF
ncbi:MAG: porin [Gammaproteobacteria bacterium]|nr:porin [Gammaproteobacteria bacterium]